jgi:integrase
VSSLGSRTFQEKPTHINLIDVNRYFSLRDIEGICKTWQGESKRWIKTYLDYVSWKIDEDKTLSYMQQVKEHSSVTYYRKQIYQIRRFLEYLNVEWASKIKLPQEPTYIPKRITSEDISNTINYFKDNRYYLQCKSLILLGSTCGARAEELYQLRIEDIDTDGMTIHINHNPKLRQTTKTKLSRISFFTPDAKASLIEYLAFFRDKDTHLDHLYSQNHVANLFKDAPLKVKDLRKYFSQTWDRNSGPTGVKKILMGHSLKSDVDCQHYNGQSEEDLKKIYEKVMGAVRE